MAIQIRRFFPSSFLIIPLLFLLILQVGLVFGQGKTFTAVDKIPTSYRSVDAESQIVTVDEDEVVVCWRSQRAGAAYANLYLQRLNKDGELLWSADGNTLCPVGANQGRFAMAPDGYGGVVVIWEDFREGESEVKIYAQRLNYRGEALWDRDGVQVCEQKGRQVNPAIVSDAKNGFFVVWEDSRNGRDNIDIYAQHINLGGQIGWKYEGMPVCVAPNLQQNYQVCSDDYGGMVVLWEDFRNGTYWNLFAQRVNEFGQQVWNENGLDLFAGVTENQKNPHLIPDGTGGFVFVYQKYSDYTRAFDIARGRIDAEGNLVYQYSVCFSQEDQINPKIYRKGKQAFIVWEDFRYGDQDVYAQMIQIGDGLIQWEANGRPVFKGPGVQGRPQMLTSIEGNYQIVFWESEVDGKKSIWASRLDQFGAPVWAEGDRVLVTNGNKGQDQLFLWPMDVNSFWASWTDHEDRFGSKIHVQKYQSSCKTTRDVRGFRLAARHNSSFAKIEDLRISVAQNGDFFLAWKDFRNGTDNPDIFLQRFNSKGERMWKNGGINVTPVKGGQGQPVLVNDGAGGLIVCWVDRRKGSHDANVYAQRISRKGVTLWRNKGVKVCDAPKSQSYIKAVTDGREGVILAWSDARDLLKTGFDLYIQRVNHAGEPLWGDNGKPFARYPGLQSSPSLISDGNSGAYISWMDMREGPANVYLQHINQYGIYEWEYGGRAAAKAPYNQRNPEIVKNFQDDLYLVWEDSKLGDGNERIVMQCLTPSGFQVWGRNGNRVCPGTSGRQTSPRIRTDASGNLWVSWLDGRNLILGQQLMMQKFEISGEPQWEAGGISIGENLREYNDYSMVINKAGYSYLCWNSESSGNLHDVFVQTLRPDGIKKQNMDGVAMGGIQTDHLFPSCGINGDQIVMFVWVEADGEIYKVFGKPGGNE